MPTRKLAIVISHPIQYYAPVFRSLSEPGPLDVRVFYTWSQAAQGPVVDPGFGAEVTWDLPLLAGYASQFVRNVAPRPGTEHFRGLHNPTLIREIENWHADAILVYGWNARSHLLAIRHFAGRIPVLFRGDSTLLDRRSRWRAALRRIFLRWVYSHVDTAIAVGSNSRDYFAWCGLPPQRIALAPHSVDTSRFAAENVDHETRAAQWRRQLGIAADDIVFLYAGKLQSKKNPHLLMAAFAALQAGAHLVYVGGGELQGELESRAKALARVHFIPFQNQSVMPAVYRLGDLFVLPSQGPGETWGLALNEAMASGRAIAASTQVGGARDLIRPGENGWIFESGDAAQLRDILAAAVERGKAGLKSMGVAAQTLSSRWSSDESAARIKDAVLACQKRR